MKTVSKDIPLAEITLRKYELPINLSKRELIKKLCLSLGLLQPGDSRDVIVDIFLVVLENKDLSSEDVQKKVVESRKKENFALNGIASSNIRRQLKRLKDLFLIENFNNKYRINENESLIKIFEEKIEKYYIKNILNRIKEYCKELQ